MCTWPASAPDRVLLLAAVARESEVWMGDEQAGKTPPTTTEENTGYRVEKREGTRWWTVLDPAGELVCLTVFRGGAREVATRLNAAEKNG